MYFLICKKANCSGCKAFKISISAYNSNGKCQLTIEENCAYSFICRSCKLVYFFDFEKVITPEAL